MLATALSSRTFEQQRVDRSVRQHTTPSLSARRCARRRRSERRVRLVGLDFAVLGKISERFVEDFARNQNFRFHFSPCRDKKSRRGASDSEPQLSHSARITLRAPDVAAAPLAHRNATTMPISDHRTSTADAEPEGRRVAGRRPCRRRYRQPSRRAAEVCPTRQSRRCWRRSCHAGAYPVRFTSFAIDHDSVKPGTASPVSTAAMT